MVIIKDKGDEIPMRQELKYTEIRLDKENSEPLYLQLAGALRRQIGMTCLNSNERMISERQLSEQLGVDRTTVSKAYCELLKEGLLTRRTPKTLCISSESRQIQVSPFPNIGIIIPLQFSCLLEAHGLTIHYIKGIIDSAAARNISTIMIQLPDCDASNAEIDRFIDELAKRLIGVIHIGGRGIYPDRPLERLMKFEKLPQVMISAYSHFSNIGTVTAEPSSGGCALAEQIKAFGHQSIGIVNYMSSFYDEGRDGYFIYEAFTRAEKLLRIFKRYRLNCDERFHCFKCRSFSATLKILKEKKKEGNLPTVYWCVNDEIAHWVIDALTELGLKVPEDISVVGYDGAPITSEENLTTISIPFYSIGYRALKMLLNHYENGINNSNRIASLQTFLVSKKTLSYAKDKNTKYPTGM